MCKNLFTFLTFKRELRLDIIALFAKNNFDKGKEIEEFESKLKSSAVDFSFELSYLNVLIKNYSHVFRTK